MAWIYWGRWYLHAVESQVIKRLSNGFLPAWCQAIIRANVFAWLKKILSTENREGKRVIKVKEFKNYISASNLSYQGLIIMKIINMMIIRVPWQNIMTLQYFYVIIVVIIISYNNEYWFTACTRILNRQTFEYLSSVEQNTIWINDLQVNNIAENHTSFL